MQQDMPVLRDVPVDGADPSFQEPSSASNRPDADVKDAIGSVRVIERAVCEKSAPAGRSFLDA